MKVNIKAAIKRKMKDNGLKDRGGLAVYIMIILVIVLFVGYFVWYNFTLYDRVGFNAVEFSLESGFYDSDIQVSLKKNSILPAQSEVHYTVSGDDPNAKTERYTKPFEFIADNETKVIPLKVVVCSKSGSCSRAAEQTFIIGKNIKQDMNIDVASVTSDKYNLYDYDYGILVKGRIYEKGEKDVGGNIMGNYSMRDDEWLRDGSFSLFDSTGQIETEQPVLLGTAGGASVQWAVKSLKIKALEGEKLKVDFDEAPNDRLTSTPTKYSSVRLRAGDLASYDIQTGLVSKLAQESNFDGIFDSKKTIVYLNGEFYSVFTLYQNYSNSYIAHKFGFDSGDDIEKYKFSEESTFSEAGITDLFKADLNDQSSRERLEAEVDMDNYLKYYALQVLWNNIDWPHNNYEIWRYKGKENDNKYSDGKWRFLIYDMDNIYLPDISKTRYQEGILKYLTGNYKADMETSFSNVIKSKYYRDKFLTIMRDLLNGPFVTENVLKILNEEQEKIQHQVQLHMDEEEKRKYETRINNMKSTITKRSERLEAELNEYLSVNDKYFVTVKTDEGSMAKWVGHNLYQSQYYNNYYYDGTEIALTRGNVPGYEFKYWLVNGEKIFADSVMISDDLADNGEIEVQLISERVPVALIITRLSAKSNNDWVKIANVGEQPINLGEYYISDTKSNLRKCKLPDMNLESGESFVIDGGAEKRGDFTCKLKLSYGETVYLSHGSDVVDRMFVVEMGENETYGRYLRSEEMRWGKQ